MDGEPQRRSSLWTGSTPDINLLYTIAMWSLSLGIDNRNGDPIDNLSLIILNRVREPQSHRTLERPV